MTDFEWTNNFGEHCFGKQTNGVLRNTIGACIWPNDGMFIAKFGGNQYVVPVKPFIICRADKFEIKE
jgi:hypothetical protein